MMDAAAITANYKVGHKISKLETFFYTDVFMSNTKSVVT